MSVANQFKNLFSKKTPDSEQDSRMSLATPEGSYGQTSADTMMASTDHSPLLPQDNANLPAQEGVLAPVALEATDLVALPVLGKRTVGQHQKSLFILLGLALVTLATVALYVVNQDDRVAQQLSATGQSLMQSQRLAKSVSQALVGGQQAFPDVADSSGVLAKTVRSLNAGDDQLKVSALSADFAPELAKVTPLMERAEKNAATVMGQQKVLTQANSALRLINRQSSDLLEIAESVSSLNCSKTRALPKSLPPGSL